MTIRALADCRRAIELDVDDDAVWVTQGWCLLNSGQRKQAEDSFRRALTINPKNGNAQGGLAWTLLVTQNGSEPRHDVGKVAFFLATEMQSSPCGLTKSWRSRILAAAHAEQGEFKEAARLMKEAVQEAPDSQPCVEQLQAYQEERCFRI